MKTNKCRKCREGAKTEITFYEENKMPNGIEKPLTKDIVHQIVTGTNPKDIDNEFEKLYEEIMIDLNEVIDNDIMENPDAPLYQEELKIGLYFEEETYQSRFVSRDVFKLMSYLSVIRNRTQFDLYQSSFNLALCENEDFNEKAILYGIIKLLEESIAIDYDKISIHIDSIHDYFKCINASRPGYRRHMRHNEVEIREISHILTSLPTTIKTLTLTTTHNIIGAI